MPDDTGQPVPATRQQLVAPDFSSAASVRDWIASVVKGAVQLKITTVIGTLEPKATDTTSDPELTVKDVTQGAYTSINLAFGDIYNAADPSFFTDAGAQLRDFHAKQVELSRLIVSDNLKAITHVATTIWTSLTEKKSGQ